MLQQKRTINSQHLSASLEIWINWNGSEGGKTSFLVILLDYIELLGCVQDGGIKNQIWRNRPNKLAIIWPTIKNAYTGIE